jgi:hypothetical protein
MAQRQDDTVKTGKQFADFASDLTDEEIQRTVRIINDVRNKHMGKKDSPENLEMLRDEILTRLAEINVLAELDPSPLFHGQPPILEIIGKISTDPIHKYGFDHERKRHEVIESKKRGRGSSLS